MLRRKEAASQPEDFTEGTFRALIPDEVADPEKVDTLLLCSGRITWDLMVERAKQQADSPTTAIARIEQLYPEPLEETPGRDRALPEPATRSGGCRTSRPTWARRRTCG